LNDFVDNLDNKQIDNYWLEINNGSEALYSIDNSFSFFGEKQGSFNLKDLKTELDLMTDKNRRKVIGIHSPYVYLGTPNSSFAMVNNFFKNLNQKSILKKF
jgi:hypothetical protein